MDTTDSSRSYETPTGFELGWHVFSGKIRIFLKFTDLWNLATPMACLFLELQRIRACNPASRAFSQRTTGTSLFFYSLLSTIGQLQSTSDFLSKFRLDSA